MGAEGAVGPMMKAASILTLLAFIIFTVGISLPTMVVVMMPQQKLGSGIMMGIYNICVNPVKSAEGANQGIAGLFGALLGGLAAMDPNVPAEDKWTCGGVDDGGNGMMRMILAIVGVFLAGFCAHKCNKGGTRGQQVGSMIGMLCIMAYLYFVPLVDTGGIATSGMGLFLLMGCMGLMLIALILRLMVNDAGAAMMAAEVQSEARVQSESSEGSESVGKESSEA